MSNIEVVNARDSDWFKQESLILFKSKLAEHTFPGYPSTAERIYGSLDGLDIPPEWPSHPWLEEMLDDPEIGVVTDKRFFRNYGPNMTADPIIVRQDIGDEPHVLLIERGDGTGWALPGGFIEPGEEQEDAAIRESEEETGIDLAKLRFKSQKVYQGTLADIRATAHAWPETSAFLFELDLKRRRDRRLVAEMMAPKRWQRVLRSIGEIAAKDRVTRLPWKGGDDAKRAAWVASSKVTDKIFGSHRLLIDLALRDLRHGNFTH